MLNYANGRLWISGQYQNYLEENVFFMVADCLTEVAVLLAVIYVELWRIFWLYYGFSWISFLIAFLSLNTSNNSLKEGWVIIVAHQLKKKELVFLFSMIK